MSKVFAKRIVNKKVMSTDGSEIGTLSNVVIDVRSGSLVDLVVRPDIALNIQGYREEGGFLFLPFESVHAIKDYIVVEKGEAERGEF